MASGKTSYRVREAQRKNAQKAAQRKKEQQRKAFWDQHGKKIIGIACAIVLLIIVIFLCVKLFYGPDGSIPNFFGSLRGVQNNWVVTNTGTTKAPRYYRLANFDVPAGYTLDPEYRVSTDTLAQTFRINADEPDIISAAYIAGVANYDSTTILETYLGYGMYTESTEIKETTLQGHTAHYATVTYPSGDVSSDEIDPETTVGSRTLVLYADTIRDSVILVSIQSTEGTLATRPSEDEMLTAAEPILSALSFPD